MCIRQWVVDHPAFGLAGLTPAGVTEISRWLSAATPPDDESHSNSPSRRDGRGASRGLAEREGETPAEPLGQRMSTLARGSAGASPSRRIDRESKSSGIPPGCKAVDRESAPVVSLRSTTGSFLSSLWDGKQPH